MSDYEILNLVIQGIIGLAILATFTIYFFQLSTMRKSTLGQNSISLINYLQDESAREARRIVMSTLGDKDFTTWNKREIIAASKVCATYDVVSILLYKQKLVSPNIVIENWYPSIIKCYRALERYITEQQKEDNYGPHYWNDFEKLYEEAIKFSKTNNQENP